MSLSKLDTTVPLLFSLLLFVLTNISSADFDVAGNVLIAGAGYGEICFNETGCDADQYLECVEEDENTDHVCRCIGEATNDTFHTSDQCLIRSESPCEVNPNCIDNAQCLGPEGTKTCQCNNGYVPELGFCFGSYETPCFGDTLTVCSIERSLFCDDETSTCQCYSSHEWWTDSEKCNPLVGTICEEEEGDQCPAGAACTPTAYKGQCQCDWRHSETDDHHCKFRYGATCDPAVKPDQCNQDEMLVCDQRSNKCSCNEESAYSIFGERCYVKIGGVCDQAFGPRDRVCVLQSVCVEKEYPYGVCLCKDGFEPSADNTTCNSAVSLIANIGLGMMLLISIKVVYIN